MSIIPSIYNQGTGLVTPIGEGVGLPIIVDDLVVNGNLTVLGTSQLIGDVSCDSNLTVSQTTTSEDLIVNNNTILDNGVGQNSSALFKLPIISGNNNDVLTITDDSVNPIITEWQPPASINDYVQYDLLTAKLKNNVLNVVSDINNLTVDNSIGLTGQRFKLPSNTTGATNNQVLAILNSAVNPKTTSWITPTIIAPTTFNNNSIGSNTISNTITVVINTGVLLSGLYIVSYETAIQNTASRTFTSFSTCIGTSPDFVNPVRGLFTSSFISALVPVGIQRKTACAVVSLSASSTLYLVVQNVFTGLSYLTTGSIRTAKIG